MTTESETTLKDIMASLSDIKTSVQNINGRLTKLDTSMENVNVRLNKLEALDFKIAQVEESQDFISKEYEAQKATINEIQKKNKYPEGENSLLHKRIISLEKIAYSEQEKHIHLEQYGRREMVEIRGIPKKDSENCVQIVKKLCQLVGMENCNNTVEIAHRIKNGDIIAKFRDRPTRDKLYNKKECLKNLSTKDLRFQEEHYIFINESLVFDTKKLLYEVREKCREIGIKKILTNNGIIKIKCNEHGSKWESIKNKFDLDKIR